MPLIILNKPFRVLSQFSAPDGRPTLADFVDVPGVYPAGRLDFDSEGLILLTDDGRLQARISQPGSKIPKIYLVQVEGKPSAAQLEQLESGIRLKDGPASATLARRIREPECLWSRNPPVRERKTVPDAWLEIGLCQGRNRQVRRMTAAVGLPTLRLIRWRVGPWALGALQPGEFRRVSNKEAWRALNQTRGRSRGEDVPAF